MVVNVSKLKTYFKRKQVDVTDNKETIVIKDEPIDELPKRGQQQQQPQQPGRKKRGPSKKSKKHATPTFNNDSQYNQESQQNTFQTKRNTSDGVLNSRGTRRSSRIAARTIT